MTKSFVDPSLKKDASPQIQRDLRAQKYALFNESDLGFSSHIRTHIQQRYFNDTVLKSYPGDIPADRLRARDVIQYRWRDDELTLVEHDTIAIENRSGWLGKREFDRVAILDDELFTSWMRSILELVPSEKRLDKGTFGVNMFRTFTNVVTAPHHDGEQWVLIYVVDKTCAGAATTLHPATDDSEIVRTTLEPGDMILFDDTEFRHNSSPLIPLAGQAPRRDAVICTVNFADTYPIED